MPVGQRGERLNVLDSVLAHSKIDIHNYRVMRRKRNAMGNSLPSETNPDECSGAMKDTRTHVCHLCIHQPSRHLLGAYEHTSVVALVWSTTRLSSSLDFLIFG